MANNKKARTAVENVIGKLFFGHSEALDKKFNLTAMKDIVDTGRVITVYENDQMVYCVSIDGRKIINELTTRNEISNLCKIEIREHLE